MNWPKGGWVWGRPEKGPWPLPSETPLRRKTGSPSPNREPSTPWRGRSHGGDHRARVRKDEACPAEEWPRTQTPHLDMFRALSLTHTPESRWALFPAQAGFLGLDLRICLASSTKGKSAARRDQGPPSTHDCLLVSSVLSYFTGAPPRGLLHHPNPATPSHW